MAISMEGPIFRELKNWVNVRVILGLYLGYVGTMLVICWGSTQLIGLNLAKFDYIGLNWTKLGSTQLNCSDQFKLNATLISHCQLPIINYQLPTAILPSIM